MQLGSTFSGIFCCLALFGVFDLQVDAKRKGHRRSITGLDLLEEKPISAKQDQTEVLDTKWRQYNLTSGKISRINLKKLRLKNTGSLTAEFIGYSAKKNVSTLLAIHARNKKLPLFEISVDVYRRKVILRYQGSKAFQRTTIAFGKILENWLVLSAKVNKTHFSVTLGCSEEKSVKLREEIGKFPRKSFAVVGSAIDKQNRFVGQLVRVRLYPRAVGKKTLMCSKPVKFPQSLEGFQSDSAGVDDIRILRLEEQITKLNKMVARLRSENSDLIAQVASLETCNSDCVLDGQLFDEGDTWSKDMCTVCVCKDGKADCLRRTDIPACQAPCTANPCMNTGQCVSFAETQGPDYHCSCNPPYEGELCEIRGNPCVWPAEPGICDEIVERFFYDRFTQQCQAFNYTGCGGNVNNYETLEDCQAVAITGACCYRQFSLKVEDVIVSNQNEVFGCKNLTLMECQETHRQVVGVTELEVTSFFPGLSCDEAGCGQKVKGCMIEDRMYEVGEKAVLGCQDCTCERSGQFICSCSKKAVRKEVRDMTGEELAQFQAAVQKLRLVGPGNPWEEFRDVYMRHTMHSNGGPFFLPWHRMFLRQLEQRLQEIDCSITLPYYDFTTDVGNFADAIIWQPNYFGGDGEQGCVPDHPFGLSGSWRPCIMRQFNPEVALPNLVELALGLASDDYMEMSMCLESYVSYIHTFIGGDMATDTAAYDPVFYSIHAYVDMLYSWWQAKGNNKFKYPAAFGNIPMVPFNIPPSAILDLGADLCVTYKAPSTGSPCNITEQKSQDRNRGDITPDKVGTNEPGYTDGYDRRGFGSDGYKRDGYNRDGFTRDGFNRQGYNRYGYDVDGYDAYGYDNEGYNKANEADDTGRYKPYGFNKQCLDRRGLTANGYDKFGFTPAGFDRNNCNFFFNGSFATLQSNQIWDILKIQDKNFLMTIPRTCPELGPLPISWVQRYWITDIKDVTGIIPVDLESTPKGHNSARFCFDTDSFLTSCGCETGIAVCTENPCLTDVCPSYPEATCQINFCGECKSRWFVNGEEVDCFEERDFCEPNPCLNGGTCLQSIWSKEPHLTTCQCPPGFEGHHCQYQALDVCQLSVSPGRCTSQERRWYFDYSTQSCNEFVYTGCNGNANNFESRRECENRCQVGACCFRWPAFPEIPIGYDYQGYDKYGFNVDGYDREGHVRTEENGIKSGLDRFGSDRLDWQKYDRNGYDTEGFDRLGYDKSGYDKYGFNQTGYSRSGEYDGIIDYNKKGYDAEGYNRAGYKCQGNSRLGLNVFEVSVQYKYECRSLTLKRCQRIERQQGHKVVKFAPGKTCEEAKCGENCGCSYNNVTYKLGESFSTGCQSCRCTLTGVVECLCSEIYRRKEIRDMSRTELETYQNAVKKMNQMSHPSRWYRLAEMYAEHKPQAVGNPASLPWHRLFLRLVERDLQEIDCSIRIPYYDWTLDAGNQQRAVVWAANIFGGNGADVTGCVQHHPFKDYYPPYWAPCLRRVFNNSIQLPDAVDIQYALNEGSYEKFRLNMDLFMNIYQSWVGGHMATDYSPYDPLFLSVAAFIDRLWADWQKQLGNGMLAYPQELRYVPMAPFKSSPDNVMDNKRQLCVSYLPLTEGAACNVTLPNYQNNNGFDRHGYDREGYDKDGFNVFGVNRNGEKDDRGVFNTYGFDKEGFKRNGYDNMNLDRFGFFIDGYNVDGFDAAGLDRSGYDRYGFDKMGMTPFGFYRNGTMLVSTLPDVYDRYGYNRYGLDRYGFDRQNYDIFGFDAKGYDRNRCNKGSLGQMLVIIKRWSEVQLKKLDDKTIRILTRICPPLSVMPEWRYTVNWLRRGVQVPLIEGIVGRAQARINQNKPMLRPTSVTEDNIWLPLSPDRSLCFVTYYYTECPLGSPPVSCQQDLCAGRRCPGFPEAVCRTSRCGDCKHEWYNGVTGNPLECRGCIDASDVEHGEGTSWQTSVCEQCTCQDGLIQCTETQCGPPTCLHPIQLPRLCCPSCDAGCDYQGVKYENGRRFVPQDDRCSQCLCQGGTVTCQKSPCPDLGDCLSAVTLEGECCPSCMDCGNRANASVWMETPCQQCQCVNGAVQCLRIQCSPPSCRHPRIARGECCPACEGCLYNGIELNDGEEYQPDQCTVCVCGEGSVECGRVPCPDVVCSNPITPPGECCPRCDNECTYDSRQYRHGESFMHSTDNCMNCTCDNTLVQCLPVLCPRRNLPCRRPITLPGECCPSQCPTCVSEEGRDYNTGEMWKSLRDPCQSCLCEEGVTSCYRQEACPVSCDHGIVPQGECCSPCKDCLYGGQQIPDGQTFVQPGNNCQQCQCQAGQVTCQSLGPCPTLPCRVTETPPGACCPQCKQCDYQGQMFSHGDIVHKDKCSTCVCREGEVACERVSCPRLHCDSPRDVPGECCPVCDECFFRGKTYQPEQRFTPLREPCKDCTCRRGMVDCVDRQSECPAASCTHPIKTPDQCCPVCSGCSYLRRRFRNGQKFVPPGKDNCKVCRCSEGSVECNTMGCPPINCNNPVLVMGQCCPVCPMGCSVMGVDYRDGETFMDFMNRCSVCTCSMGQIRCSTMMSCEPVTCTHPTTLPGNCCPTCAMCEMNNIQYRNGQSFDDPRNSCQQCSCQAGSITCSDSSCSSSPCGSTVYQPSTCCPECLSQPCEYEGHLYGDGQEVPVSQNPCEVCRCSQGLIDCGRHTCSPVSCQNPSFDGCCQTCDDVCDYNRNRYQSGEMFPNPQNPCEDCVCEGGTVRCLEKLCAVPNCRDPVYKPGQCCPECSDCTYQGRLYEDSNRFQHPGDPCETCVCSRGDVRCTARLCAEIPCQHPSQDGCCPSCNGCQFEGRSYRNGEIKEDGCVSCECRNGNVVCQSSVCQQVTCRNPVMNGCCPECKDCMYENRRFRNGQRFPDLRDDCQQCECRDGAVSCSPLPCPAVTCSAPTQGKCCPECRGCKYIGETLRNGQSVTGFTSPCETCVCRDGEVVCSVNPCPPVTCQHPTQDICCAHCDGCRYNGQDYPNRITFPDPDDQCSECRCENGNVRCSRRRCLAVNCPNPVQGVCCPVCGETASCVYNGREYQIEQTFSDQRDPCGQCVCRDGSVSCERQPCPPTTCSHPVRQQCCNECDKCMIDGRLRSNGERFSESCRDCVCLGGNVRCTERVCPRVNCANPVMNDCCPVCGDCTFENRVLTNGQTFADVRDVCSTCVCQNGTFDCARKACPTVSCKHPAMGECCPECRNCQIGARKIAHGETYPDLNDPCTMCVCEAGSIRCERRRCAAVRCSNPIQDRCGCGVCSDCSADGRTIQDGKRFQDTADSCRDCLCRSGTVQCHKKGCSQSCSHPAQMDSCCPVCRDCFYEGSVRTQGSVFLSDVDPCQRCSCQNGDVTCRAVQCPNNGTRCGNPIRRPGECCPTCAVCEFLGRSYSEGQTFPHPEGLCQTCTCQAGRVRCKQTVCDILCSHPVPDSCCPRCDQCLYQGRIYGNNEEFRSERDPCRMCICFGGNVQCRDQQCQTLTCLQQERRPGDCCPVCKGCAYSGVQYIDGAEWLLPDNPCIKCTCSGGFVTCMELQCLNACPGAVAVPGQCCQMCPSCSYNGVSYQEGETFSPNGDPCDTCVCKNGQLSCIRETCPSTASCPPEQLVAPQPGSCCPVCAGFHGECGNPPIIENADFIVNGNPPYLDGTNVSYTCSDGFEREGRTTYTCSIGGWGVDLTCNQIRCETLRDPENGFIVNQQRFVPAVTIHFDCNPGYTLQGQASLTCYIDGQWRPSDPPTCQIKNCGPFPAVVNADVYQDTFISEANVYGQTVTITCNTGFVLNGRRASPCQASGEWELPGATCEPVDCGNHPGVNGTCVSQTYLTSSTLYLICTDHSTSIGGSGGATDCNPNTQTWDDLHFSCKCDCEIPSSPGAVFNNVVDGYIEHDAVLDWTCSSGTVSTSEVLRCLDGVIQVPSCITPSIIAIGTDCTRERLGEVTYPRPEDRCFRCVCQETFNWVCSQRTCPPLACQLSQQRTQPGGCCPQCTDCYDNRNGQYYGDGEEWVNPSSPCYICSCQGGSITCRAKECPVMRCPMGSALVQVPGQCCDECRRVNNDVSCVYEGQTFRSDEEWRVDECTSCQCNSGVVKCTSQTCQTQDCGPEESLSVLPGTCCPVCIPKPATCLVFGDPHYLTFDGSTLHFQGTCKYIMSMDCAGKDFTVEVQHDDRGEPGQVSWAQNFTVTTGGMKVDLLQDHRVLVNGREVRLPYVRGSELSVERNGDSVLLNTRAGVKLLWNGESYGELTVPGNYKRKLCGLCGNFNGFPMDDLRTKSGQTTNSPSIFGNSWKSPEQTSRCTDSQDVDPCAQAGYRVRKRASSRCAVLQGSSFSRCHRAVDVAPYVSSCKYDLCACNSGTDCLCDILAVYATECAKAGVRLEWRTPTLCAIDCDKERGFLFDECGPVCHRTCENWRNPLGNLTDNCFKPCIAGCQCPADKVLHAGRCIRTSECPNIQHSLK